MIKHNIISRIGEAAERVILSHVRSNNLFAEYYNRSDKKAQWKRQATTYSKKEINDWKVAVMAATDPENPRRGLLMRFYQSLMLDLHLASIIDTRILRVQRSSFKIVDANGKENVELKELLERPWYEELVRLICFTPFQGTTLIELFDTDENGELVRVTEIPQSNFLAHKGIVIKEEYDDNGVAYIDGGYKDYYIQIGNNYQLGMLNQLAMIVLAKKIGLGSWISWIDRFGVPPVFAITERMDPGRRDELFEMLENFRMNHFAVLQGNEKIEVPANYNVDAYNSFKTLMSDFCNTEMSKRVLGGTATVEEKSFVGSAQVQERVAQDRHEADKLLFKYYFNTQVRQRLAKISSVYSGFATHTLVWDNQETLNIEKYIEGVEKLSVNYDFDIDEIRKRTGLPIIGVKTQPIIPITESTQKKKIDATLKSLSYAPFAKTYNLYAATWDAAIERLAISIYNGEVQPSDLDRDLVLKNYAALNTEAYSGWGKDYYESLTTRKIRENLLRFSGAKSHNLIDKLTQITKANLSKEDFISHAKKTVQLHNETWSNVEKKFAANSASAARDFEGYQKDTDIYPNLKNRTIGDENVRESHAVNDGVIKPLKDWTQIPPYDPGCRCWLEQTNEPPTLSRTMQNLDKGWANNAYFSGKIFVDNHSYFQTISKSSRSNVFTNTETMKQYIPYSRTIKAGNKKVFINDFADLSDMAQNIEAAKRLASALDKNIYIRPHINNMNVRNPELGIGGINNKGDLKTYSQMVNGKPVDIEKFMINSIKSANSQGVASLVIDISAHTGDYQEIITRRLTGGLNKINKNIKEVIILKGDKVGVITRKQVASHMFDDFFKQLL